MIILKTKDILHKHNIKCEKQDILKAIKDYSENQQAIIKEYFGLYTGEAMIIDIIADNYCMPKKDILYLISSVVAFLKQNNVKSFSNSEQAKYYLDFFFRKIKDEDEIVTNDDIAQLKSQLLKYLAKDDVIAIMNDKIMPLKSSVNFCRSSDKEYQRKLVELYQTTNEQKYLDELVLIYDKMFKKFAHTYKSYSLTFEDVYQEAVIGFITAVKRFDINTTNALSTYVYWWIRQNINRSLMDKTKTIRIPIHLTEKFNKIRAYKENFFKEYQREATTEELIELSGYSKKTIENYYIYVNDTASLNGLINEEDTEFGDLIADDKAVIAENEVEKSLISQDVFNILKERLS